MRKTNVEHIIQIHKKKTGYFFDRIEEVTCVNTCNKHNNCTLKNDCKNSNFDFYKYFNPDIIVSDDEKCKYITCKIDSLSECPYLFLKPLEDGKNRSNPYRFVQCYVNNPEFIEFLESNDYIASAALFRIHHIKENKTLYSDEFWYPFFTGNAYVQLPTFAPLDIINDDNEKFPEKLRWLVTTQRNELKINSIKDSNKFNLFEKIQTTKFNKDCDNRYIDVCDGYASFLMLYFIICRRLESIKEKKREIKYFYNNIEWIYSDLNIDFLDWVYKYYKPESISDTEREIKILKLKYCQEKDQWIRNSTWKDDLQLLGLIDKDCKSTKRFEFFKIWFEKDIEASDDKIRDYKKKLQEIITINDGTFDCENFPISIKNDIDYSDSLNYDAAKVNFTLQPPMHIIVRAFQNTPIRWMFIPFGVFWQETESKFINTSGMILLLRDNLNSRAYNPQIAQEKNIIHNRINELLPVLTSLFTIEEQSLQDHVNLERRKLDKQNTEAQTRAAISQLYARTDAHDLGHVLDALKSMEDIFSDETDNKQYKYDNHPNSQLNNSDKNGLLDIIGILNLHYKNCNCIETSNCNYLNESHTFYPKLIGDFIKFLKERMDFRADVATTDPNSLTTLDFYQDVFLPFNNNLIFNNRISGISDTTLKYCFEIKYNGNENVKVPVAIPNDVLGCHAMYIVWSNIIRNTIKHGDLPENKDVTFTIEINDWEPNKEFYEINIYTNNFKAQLTDDELKEIEDIHKSNDSQKEKNLKKFKDKADIDGLVKQRNITFQDTILNKQNNRLRDSSLGSIEMDTCAAYLRKLPVTEVENEIYDLFDKKGNSVENYYIIIEGKKLPKILHAYAQENKDKTKYSLGYRFYLQKPKEVLLVTDEKDKTIKMLFYGTITEEDLNIAGIQFITSDELNNQIYDHKFLVFHGTQEKLTDILKKNKVNLSTIPKRQIVIQNHFFCKINEFAKYCWEEWNKTFKSNIEIYFNEERIFPKESEINKLTVKIFHHASGLTVDEFFDPLYYNEMKCGHHWITGNLALKDVVFTNNDKYLQYIETVFTNVIIIDERIQKSIVLHGKQYGNNFPFSPYFENLGIYIPSPLLNENKTLDLLGCKGDDYKQIHLNDPNLNSKTLSNEKNNLKEYISKYASKSHFIVIHLGILEKLLDNKMEEKTSNKIESIIKEIVPIEENWNKIIITSGRGKPNNLPDTYSFVPISLIQNAIETTFDKYRLVQILYNSRKSVK